jgi:lipopolysaccharide export system protein LptC
LAVGNRSESWFPLVLLAFVAALTFWLDRIVQPPTPGLAGVLRHDPDYIVNGLSAVRTDKEGRVKHTLHAQKMTHFPDDDATVLDAPKLMTYGEDRAPVTITSQQALMSANGENVFFEKDVRVVRAATAKDGELVLETEYLHVIPDANLAKTDRPVTIRNPAAVVTASGLELNSETRVLKLQGRVKGVFEPPGKSARNAR